MAAVSIASVAPLARTCARQVCSSRASFAACCVSSDFLRASHAVRVAAYLTAGPYLQPTAPGPHGELVLAGEDWDLGVRLRRAGWTVAETEAALPSTGVGAGAQDLDDGVYGDDVDAMAF